MKHLLIATSGFKIITSFQKSCLCAIVVTFLGCYNKPKKNYDFFANKKEIEVNIDKSLFLWNEDGASLIDLTRIEQGAVYYRWRSWNKEFKNELFGSDIANQNGNSILNVGSTSLSVAQSMDFFLKSGYVNVLWTLCSSNSVWLYYSPDKTAVRLLSDKEFDGFKVSEVSSELPMKKQESP